MLEMVSWLRKARILKGLTAKQLADKCGLSFSLIQQIESGNRTMTRESEEKISNVLGFTQSEIPLDFNKLRQELTNLEEGESSGSGWCLAHYLFVDRKRVYVHFERVSSRVDKLDIEELAKKNIAPLSVKGAKQEVDSDEAYIEGTLTLQGYRIRDESGFSFESAQPLTSSGR